MATGNAPAEDPYNHSYEFPFDSLALSPARDYESHIRVNQRGGLEFRDRHLRNPHQHGPPPHAWPLTASVSLGGEIIPNTRMVRKDIPSDHWHTKPSIRIRHIPANLHELVSEFHNRARLQGLPDIEPTRIMFWSPTKYALDHGLPGVALTELILPHERHNRDTYLTDEVLPFGGPFDIKTLGGSIDISILWPHRREYIAPIQIRISDHRGVELTLTTGFVARKIAEAIKNYFVLSSDNPQAAARQPWYIPEPLPSNKSQLVHEDPVVPSERAFSDEREMPGSDRQQLSLNGIPFANFRLVSLTRAPACFHVLLTGPGGRRAKEMWIVELAWVER